MSVNDDRAKELWDSLGPAERVISQFAMEEHRRKQEVECAACGHKKRYHDRDSDGWCTLTNDGKPYTGSGYPSRIAEKKTGNECWCQGFTTDVDLGLDLLLRNAHWKGLEPALRRTVGRRDAAATSKILPRYIAMTPVESYNKPLIEGARSLVSAVSTALTSPVTIATPAVLAGTPKAEQNSQADSTPVALPGPIEVFVAPLGTPIADGHSQPGFAPKAQFLVTTMLSKPEAKKQRDAAILAVWSRRKKGDIDYKLVCRGLDDRKISVLDGWPKKTWIENLTNPSSTERTKKYIHDVIRLKKRKNGRQMP
jgi:hypothetical protein